MYYREKTLGKVATIKRFEYSQLGSELEKQTDIAKKHYQKLDKVYEFDEAINKNDRNSIIRKYKKLDLVFANIIILKKLITFLLNQIILSWPPCLMI